MKFKRLWIIKNIDGSWDVNFHSKKVKLRWLPRYSGGATVVEDDYPHKYLYKNYEFTWLNLVVWVARR